MKKKNIAWGLFFIFLAAVYLVISSTGMELGVGLPGIFMTVLFVWLFVAVSYTHLTLPTN